MSKAQGQKIGIKFTDDILGLVLSEQAYKYFRWEIETRHSSRVYIYGIELKTDDSFYLPTGTITVSNQYSATYSADKAFDGSTSTYWRTDQATAWIQIELSEAIILTAFRWNTQTSTYRPKDFVLWGSKDGANWDKIYEDISPAVSNWKEFSWIPALKSGNERAFTISANQYKYIHGPLENIEYEVLTVEKHPTEANSILITVNWWTRFENAEGKIRVQYDADVGSLAGLAGSVESFDIDFIPEDLIQEPNPNVQEYLKAYPYAIELSYDEVQYIGAYHKEYLQAYPYDITIVLTYIDPENP